MTTANDLQLAVENLTDQLLQEYQAKILVAPDLPPLNITVANMDATQKYALDYWLRSENLEYIYIQMMDAQGKTYNAIYLDQDQELPPDLYVSAFESTAGMCDDQQVEKIKLWIDQHPQFQGIRLENMEDYGVEVSSYTVANHHHSQLVALVTFIVSWGTMIFISAILGMVLIIVGIVWIFILHRRNQKNQKALQLQMWHETLTSRIESYLGHKIQKYVQQKYALADESEQQLQDDNVQEYELPDTLKQSLSKLEHAMFIETEDEKGNIVLKSVAQMKLEHEIKKENAAS